MPQPFQDAARKASIIPGLYPFYTLWGIAFLRVFDYYDSQKESLNPFFLSAGRGVELRYGKQAKKGESTMSTQISNPQESLQGLAQGDVNVLPVLVHMTEGTFEESGLDPQTFMLVRMAALATLDAAPASWMVNLGVSGEAGLTAERILGMLIAIAPVIGTARIVSAAGSIMRAGIFAKALAEQATE